MRTSRRWRAVWALAVAAIAAALARRLRRTRALVAEVADELRTPILYLPMDITNDATLTMARRLIERSTPVRPGIISTQEQVPGSPHVAVQVYEPPHRADGTAALLWIHGGGLVMGSPASGHTFCSRVADELGILVVSVDYRLAPEHPFPAGLHDCSTVLQWLHDEALELGVDPDRIAVGGDSAGGGLAASLAQLARDQDGPPIAFQMLIYPMLDDRTVVRAEAQDRNALLWTGPSNRYAWTAYLGHAPSLDEERPHAVAARCADLAGLPPAWIGVGAIDLFAEEDIDYARRLQAAGVDCELHVQPGMFHGADAVLPDKPSMQAFRDRAVTALGEALQVR